ncbi:MAG: putative flap endonuclease-1-like 5' DNA nuclease [Gammaproteobacteria bacterium]
MIDGLIKIDEVEGLGPAYAAKLTEAGIKTTDDFLKLCCDSKGRGETATKTGISEKLILSWANMADLMRVNGIGGQYAEIRHAAGVDTIKELRTRNAENLAAKMKEMNDEKNLANACPSESVVSGWIEKAKSTDPLITH